MMAERTDAREQQELPFAEAAASHAERWNDLVLALSRMGTKCDLYLSRFVRLVFDMTHGGTSGELIKSYEALAERPLWLCCSPRKVRSTIEKAERLVLVRVHRRRSYQGSQLDNGYSIDWAGVRAIISGGPTGGTSCQGGGTRRQAPGTTCHHIRNRSTSEVQNSETGPGAEPNPRKDFSDSDCGSDGAADGVENETGGVRGLSARLAGQSPVLAKARGRRIVPLPAGGLAHGLWAGLNSRHLRRPLSLVGWHRQQLSTAAPAMGGTEADLLLTIAAALYAVSVPEAEVRKNRVAIFVSTLSRKRWCSVMQFVPQARKLLDDAAERYGPDWADRPCGKGQFADDPLHSQSAAELGEGAASTDEPLPPGSGKEMQIESLGRG